MRNMFLRKFGCICTLHVSLTFHDRLVGYDRHFAFAFITAAWPGNIISQRSCLRYKYEPVWDVDLLLRYEKWLTRAINRIVCVLAKWVKLYQQIRSLMWGTFEGSIKSIWQIKQRNGQSWFTNKLSSSSWTNNSAKIPRCFRFAELRLAFLSKETGRAWKQQWRNTKRERTKRKKEKGEKNSKDVEARCKYRVTAPKISFENSQSILLSLGFNARATIELQGVLFTKCD